MRIVLLDENGQPAFQRPLWLLVFGERCHELIYLTGGRAIYNLQPDLWVCDGRLPSLAKNE